MSSLGLPLVVHGAYKEHAFELTHLTDTFSTRALMIFTLLLSSSAWRDDVGAEFQMGANAA